MKNKLLERVKIGVHNDINRLPATLALERSLYNQCERAGFAVPAYRDFVLSDFFDRLPQLEKFREEIDTFLFLKLCHDGLRMDAREEVTLIVCFSYDLNRSSLKRGEVLKDEILMHAAHGTLFAPEALGATDGASGANLSQSLRNKEIQRVSVGYVLDVMAATDASDILEEDNFHENWVRVKKPV